MDQICNSPEGRYSPPTQEPRVNPTSEEIYSFSSPLRNRSLSILNTRNSQEARRTDTPIPQGPFLFSEWQGYQTLGPSLFNYDGPSPVPAIAANSTFSGNLANRSIARELLPEHPAIYNEVDEYSIYDEMIREACRALSDDENQTCSFFPPIGR